jgi:hypothetical protein
MSERLDRQTREALVKGTTYENHPSGMKCVTCERDIPECEIDDDQLLRVREMQCCECWYGLER